MESLDDSRIAHWGHEPESGARASCPLSTRSVWRLAKAGETSAHRFMGRPPRSSPIWPRRHSVVRSIWWLAALSRFAFAGVAQNVETPAARAWPVHVLKPQRVVWLDSNRAYFGASALLTLPDGQLLTVDDRQPMVWRIDLLPQTNRARLTPLPWLSAPALASAAPIQGGGYDFEGLARDESGRIYLSEESHRWILRCDPKSTKVERLEIDWAPVKELFSPDLNASFEGIAIADGKLYVANERTSAAIIVVDLGTLKVIESFTVWPLDPGWLGVLHYSDLSWSEGHLWILCRHHRVILEVDAAKHEVLAEYRYGRIEDALDYAKPVPTGIMEGLAVTPDAIWLLTDNNGWPRQGQLTDTRPALVKCRRPPRPGR